MLLVGNIHDLFVSFVFLADTSVEEMDTTMDDSVVDGSAKKKKKKKKDKKE